MFCKEVIGHFEYLRAKLTEINIKFEKKPPGFKDVNEQLLEDIVGVWIKSRLPILSKNRIQTKLKDLLGKWKLSLKRGKKKTSSHEEEWLSKLFDICKCKCNHEQELKFHKGKVLCACAFEDRIPAIEVEFLLDQRSDRKMMIGWSLDNKFSKRAMEKAKRMRKEVDTNSSSASASRAVAANLPCITATKLRKRKIMEVESETLLANLESSDEDETDSTFLLKPITGGSQYAKLKTLKVSNESYILADRRMTSIRQQSDQLLCCGGAEIAASPSTIFRQREKVRMMALQKVEAQLCACKFLQLCYDGRVVNRSDRYVFLGQFIDEKRVKAEALIAVKSFSSGTSVTSEILYNTITQDACDSILPNIYSVMADTTAVNTGKKSGVNKRLKDFFDENMEHSIHTLECLFHVNAIYLTHVISLIEGRTKGPAMMQDGALLNKIRSIEKPTLSDILSHHMLPTVPITNIAAVHLKGKIEWFAEQKEVTKAQNDDLRSDQMCMLVLACSTFMDVPHNLKHLLIYKQETICNSGWITTANGYLRLFLFQFDKLSTADKSKLIKLVSYIVSVYVPSFIMIHLKPKACDGPFITLFQRDLLLAYRDIEEVVDVVYRYFVEHGSQWLSPENVALSLFSESPPFPLEIVKTPTSLPETIDIRNLLKSRAARLKNFFTVQSQFATCVMCAHVPPSFWRSMDNNNRSTERRIGKLKNVIGERISDESNRRADLRLRAFLCNME